ncbi:MAG: hypothetical protein U9Q80_02910 [Bacillota bacterium]|nr:hypothetical protein [Bacillota bacterium]
MKNEKILIFTLLIILVIPTIVFAADSEEINVIDEVGSCPVYGLHRMFNQGGIVGAYYNGDFESEVNYYVCECGETMITTGRPHLGHPVGYYWYDTQFEFISTFWYTGFDLSMPEDPDQYTTNSYLEGYRFYQ